MKYKLSRSIWILDKSFMHKVPNTVLYIFALNLFIINWISSILDAIFEYM